MYFYKYLRSKGRIFRESRQRRTNTEDSEKIRSRCVERESDTREEDIISILDGGLVQDRSEILGIGSIVTLVRVGGPLMPDGAEEDHAGHLAEQLKESDDETHRTHHVESGN